PVTSSGIGYLLQAVAINARRAIKAGELDFSERGEETVYGRRARVLELVVPKKSAKHYDGRRFVISQDIESKILFKITVYDGDDELVETYGYENLLLNAPLANADFDPKNPDYRF